MLISTRTNKFEILYDCKQWSDLGFEVSFLVFCFIGYLFMFLVQSF